MVREEHEKQYDHHKCKSFHIRAKCPVCVKQATARAIKEALEKEKTTTEEGNDWLVMEWPEVKAVFQEYGA